MTDQPSRTGWEIRPIGSSHTGWGLIFNGEIQASHPSAFVLGAYLDDGGPPPAPQPFK